MLTELCFFRVKRIWKRIEHRRNDCVADDFEGTGISI